MRRGRACWRAWNVIEAVAEIGAAMEVGAVDVSLCGSLAELQAQAEGRLGDSAYVASLEALHAVDPDDDRTREEWRADWNESRGSTRAPTPTSGKAKAQKRDKKKKRKQRKR